MTFRTQSFVGMLFAASVALGVSTLLGERVVLRSMYEDIDAGLLNQARLAGALVSQPGTSDLDAEADAIGQLIGERVTFIARDGTVYGDSAVDRAGLATLENHATREEIVQAAHSGTGLASRTSNTTGIETRYAAVTVPNGPVA